MYWLEPGLGKLGFPRRGEEPKKPRKFGAFSVLDFFCLGLALGELLEALTLGSEVALGEKVCG